MPELQQQGVQAIGVLVHEGGTQSRPERAPTRTAATALTGPIVDINNRIDDAVDLIVSAHTHTAYNCLLAGRGGDPRLVTSAGYYGRLVSDIRLSSTARPATWTAAATYRATNVPVTRDAPDAEVAVDRRLLGRPVGRPGQRGRRLPRPRTRQRPCRGQRAVRAAVGNLVAQAQLEALQEEQYGSRSSPS